MHMYVTFELLTDCKADFAMGDMFCIAPSRCIESFSALAWSRALEQACKVQLNLPGHGRISGPLRSHLQAYLGYLLSSEGSIYSAKSPSALTETV